MSSNFAKSRKRSSSYQSRSSSEEPSKKRLSHKELRERRNQLLSERFGYSNESNPFGDTALSQPFVWKKKVQLLQAAGRKNTVSKRPEHFLEQTERKLNEIEKVRQRRQQREEEEALLQEQQAILAREREQEHFGEWQEREEAFHREGIQKRTTIRLQQGRERPSDLLAKSLRMADGEEFEDPKLLDCSADLYVDKISIDKLRKLLYDAEGHHDVCKAAAESTDDEFLQVGWARTLETSNTDHGPSREALAKHQKFWSSLLFIGTNALEKRLKASNEISETGRDVASGIAVAVLQDLDKILEGKTEEELDLIERQIRQKLKTIRGDLSSREDATYWETIQEKLPRFRAIAELRRVHQLAVKAANSTPLSVPTPQPVQMEVDQTNVEPSASESNSPYWPPLIAIEIFNLAAGALLCAEEYWISRQELRKQLIEKRKEKMRLDMQERNYKEAAARELSTVDPGLEIYEKFIREEESSMGVDEFIMTPAYEMPVPGVTSSAVSFSAGTIAAEWDTKFKTKKPRFFNRVKTGYEWTKYNQSHFDRDNPPPKAVQGYKFNLFYPDLIDKTKAPKWKLLPSDTYDTVLIRFNSGPPYQDVMFKIVNREWDLNTRHGFRNSFDRGKT